MNDEAKIDRWLRAAGQRADETRSAEELYQQVRRRAQPLTARGKQWLATYSAVSIVGCSVVMRGVELSWLNVAISWLGSACFAAVMAAVVKRLF